MAVITNGEEHGGVAPFEEGYMLEDHDPRGGGLPSLAEALGRRAFVRGVALAGSGIAAAALIGCGGDDEGEPAGT